MKLVDSAMDIIVLVLLLACILSICVGLVHKDTDRINEIKNDVIDDKTVSQLKGDVQYGEDDGMYTPYELAILIGTQSNIYGTNKFKVGGTTFVMDDSGSYKAYSKETCEAIMTNISNWFTTFKNKYSSQYKNVPSTVASMRFGFIEDSNGTDITLDDAYKMTVVLQKTSEHESYTYSCESNGVVRLIG